MPVLTCASHGYRSLSAGFGLLLVLLLSAPAYAAPKDLTCRLSAELIGNFSSRSEPLEALAISGGGSRGAWGAGFLSGWRGGLSEDDRQFDLVTGVSVGALLATHAYLGLYEQVDDGPEGLNEIFGELTNKQVRRKRAWLVWALAADSAYSNARLKKTLRRVITQELLQKVSDRQQSEQSRGLLCVATVNLRTGALVRWDLTRIAAEFATAQGEVRESLLELYRDILLAATAIPGIFSPKEISLDGLDYTVENSTSGDRHIDSGVRNQVMAPAPSVSTTSRNGEAADSEFGLLFDQVKQRSARPLKVYLLINADPQLEAKWEDPVRAFPVFKIAERSLLIILNQTAKNSRERIEVQAEKYGAVCLGVAMRSDELKPRACKAYARAGARNNEPLEALEFNCSPELFEFGVARGRAADWQACAEI